MTKMPREMPRLHSPEWARDRSPSAGSDTAVALVSRLIDMWLAEQIVADSIPVSVAVGASALLSCVVGAVILAAALA